jgi:hypothetical protein
MMTETGESELVRRAARQLGLFTVGDMAELGVSRRRLDRRLSSGAWIRLSRGVFKAGPAAPALNERELGAMLAAGKRAVLSHLTAAARLGLGGPTPGEVHVTIPASRRIAHPQGVKLWRSRDLTDADVTTRGPFRLTGVARTVLDLAGLLNDRWLRVVVDNAVRWRRSNLAWIWRTMEREGMGRKGVTRLRALLVQYQDADEIPDSALESLAMDLGLVAGRKPRLHFCVCTVDRFIAEVDFAWPEVCLALELDSWRHHGSREAFERDRARDRALATLGWTVIRHTWRTVSADRQHVVDELGRIYAQKAASSMAPGASTNQGTMQTIPTGPAALFR